MIWLFIKLRLAAASFLNPKPKTQGFHLRPSWWVRLQVCETHNHMSHNLNSLKGGYIGHYIGTTIGDIKGDTRSLDYGSYALAFDAPDLGFKAWGVGFRA